MPAFFAPGHFQERCPCETEHCSVLPHGDLLMARTEDDKITLQVTNKLAGRGITNPCKVLVASSKGQVTLTGTVQHVHQRKAAEQAANGITGVKRVNNQLVVKAEKRQ